MNTSAHCVELMLWSHRVGEVPDVKQKKAPRQLSQPRLLEPRSAESEWALVRSVSLQYQI